MLVHPRPNSQQGRKSASPSSKQVAQGPPELTAAPPQGPAHHKADTQLLPSTRGQSTALPSRKPVLASSLVSIHQEQTPDPGKPQPHRALEPGLHNGRPLPTLGPAGPHPCPQVGWHKLQDISDRVRNCPLHPAPQPTSNLTPALGSLGPVARLWDPAWHQLSSSNPRTCIHPPVWGQKP